MFRIVFALVVALFTVFVAYHVMIIYREHPFDREEFGAVKGNLHAAYKLDLLIEKDNGEFVLAEKTTILHTPKESPDDQNKRIELGGVPFLYRWPPPSGENFILGKRGVRVVDQPKQKTIIAFTIKPVHRGKRFAMYLDPAHGYRFDFISDDEISWHFQKWRCDLNEAEKKKLESLDVEGEEKDKSPD